MNTVKLIYKNERYDYEEATNREIEILGFFFEDCINRRQESYKSFKDWALADKDDPKSGYGSALGCNITSVEDDGLGNVIVEDDIPVDPENPARIKMTREQFVKLLDEWAEKIIKTLPEEVIIKHDNNEFSVEVIKQ